MENSDRRCGVATVRVSMCREIEAAAGTDAGPRCRIPRVQRGQRCVFPPTNATLNIQAQSPDILTAPSQVKVSNPTFRPFIFQKESSILCRQRGVRGRRKGGNNLRRYRYNLPAGRAQD